MKTVIHEEHNDFQLVIFPETDFEKDAVRYMNAKMRSILTPEADKLRQDVIKLASGMVECPPISNRLN